MWKRIAAVILAIVVATALFIFFPESADLDDLLDASSANDVRILRDEWGVPHVFGQTDADVAYGLAYAHAEDDFLTIQQSILAARGKLARVYGIDAAPNDYMVHLLRIWHIGSSSQFGSTRPRSGPTWRWNTGPEKSWERPGSARHE